MNSENIAAVTEALRKLGGYCFRIDGCGHWNFSDRPLYSPLRTRTAAGPIQPKRAFRIISEAALAFFGKALGGGDTLSVTDAMQSYPEVELIVQPDLQSGEAAISPNVSSTS
jgi:hypothetical protein